MEKDGFRFSIITPSFRQLERLELATASIADQAAEGFRVEHLIQDGGTPGIERAVAGWTGELLPGSNWRCEMVSEPDGGMYDAVNRGLRRAGGDLVAYLNCDEQYLPGALRKVAAWFAAHPQCEVLFADAILIDGQGNALSYRRTVLPRLWHVRLCQLNTLTCATFFRRHLVDRGFFFPAEKKVIGDALWVESLLLAGVRMGYLREATSVFELSGENLSELDRGPEGEVARRRAEFGWWGRLAKPVLATHHRLEKLLAGAYCSRSFEYQIFTRESPRQRVRKRAYWVGGRWPEMAKQASARARAITVG